MTEYNTNLPWLCAFGKYLRMVFIFLSLYFLPQGLFPQESEGATQAIPDMLRRPVRGEAPRYARDLVIGELGQGDAPESAYLFAQNILSALIEGRDDSASLASYSSSQTDNLLQELKSISTRIYRLGGGRTETDGTISFLVRFIGPEESITGELFIRGEENNWFLDDLVLEDKRSLSEIKDSYRYDFSPYERFY